MPINHDEALIITHEKIIYFGAVYYCAISKKKLALQNQFVLNKESAINHRPRLLAMKSPILCRSTIRASRRTTPCLLTPDTYVYIIKSLIISNRIKPPAS